MGTFTNESKRSALLRWLPGLACFAPYPRDAWRGDLTAGFAVCIVMIPSVLAYAELVGVAPERGLYAALGAMAGFALFSTTRIVINGPDTTIALLAGSVIAPLAGGDPLRTASLAAALAMLTGGLLVLAARIHLGNAADLLAKPVLVGYANGAALILIASQLSAMLGVPLEGDAFFLRIWDALRAVPQAHATTLALGFALIALMLALRRWAPRSPGPLIACAVAFGAVATLDLDGRGVAMLRPLPEGLPTLALPAVMWSDLQRLAPGALALAFLIFAEGILLAQTLAAKRRETIDPDAELAALGAANLVSGLAGGFSVGASGSRSITADAAGARTQLTQWVALALLVAFVIYLAPVIGYLPRVALAAILIVAGIAMLDLAGTRVLRSMDVHAFRLSLAVTLGVLVIGVLPGVLLGIALALARALYDLARPRDALLRRQAADGRFHDLDEDEPGETPPGVIVYRLYAPLLFANARHVADRLRALVADADPPAHLLVLDLQAVTHIDVTAAEVLLELYDELERSGVDVRFARANRPLREQLTAWLGNHRLGTERFFPAASAAVDDWLAHRTKL